MPCRAIVACGRPRFAVGKRLTLTLRDSGRCIHNEETITVRTVRQVAKAAGVSVRTLHHYDAIGLLKPTHVGANGYRFYGKAELLRLQQILFYRELGMPLAGI